MNRFLVFVCLVCLAGCASASQPSAHSSSSSSTSEGRSAEAAALVASPLYPAALAEARRALGHEPRVLGYSVLHVDRDTSFVYARLEGESQIVGMVAYQPDGVPSITSASYKPAVAPPG